MSTRHRVLGSLAGALGIAAAGTAIGIARQQREISHRAGERVAFGTLHSDPITVLADDGVPLHVEVDEVDHPTGSRFFRRDQPLGDVTVVFVHGYCLNLDCWHFQRAAYRNLVRTVYYDQRSHGRSGDSSRENSTIDQLGRDLRSVIDTVVPDGPLVVDGLLRNDYPHAADFRRWGRSPRGGLAFRLGTDLRRAIEDRRPRLSRIDFSRKTRGPVTRT